MWRFFIIHQQIQLSGCFTSIFSTSAETAWKGNHILPCNGSVVKQTIDAKMLQIKNTLLDLGGRAGVSTVNTINLMLVSVLRSEYKVFK